MCVGPRGGIVGVWLGADKLKPNQIMLERILQNKIFFITTSFLDFWLLKVIKLKSYSKILNFNIKS